MNINEHVALGNAARIELSVNSEFGDKKFIARYSNAKTVIKAYEQAKTEAKSEGYELAGQKHLDFVLNNPYSEASKALKGIRPTFLGGIPMCYFFGDDARKNGQVPVLYWKQDENAKIDSGKWILFYDSIDVGTWIGPLHTYVIVK